jgi:exopolysaccharide biosynthesis polyprenyl glycosylphosphotransferase
MKNNASLVFTLLLVVGDFLALLVAFMAAYILRFKIVDPELASGFSGRNFVNAMFGTLPLWIVAHGFIGLYRQEVYEKRFSELGRLLVGSCLGILTVIGYDFMTAGDLFPGRLVPIYGLGLGFSFLVLFRTFARIGRRQLFRYGIGISNMLLIGDTKASESLAEILSVTSHSGQRVIGIVGRKVEGFTHFETFDEAIKHLKQPIHGIVQTELYKDQAQNNQILEYAQQHHISYRFAPGNSDLFVGNITVDLFAGLPMIAVHQTALVGWGRIVKRIFDILVSLVLILFTSPIMLVIAVMSKLLDPKGSIFFRQTRLTRFNRRFKVFKFRSQYSKYGKGTPEEDFELMGKPELIKEYRANGDFLPHDPRVTPLGKFLRATSLDELPQLFNVLKGDLSLVGPRALIPEELDEYAKKHTILSVKSGMTGLAQISGRRDISFEERRKLDTYYVQNWSFGLDIVIILRTLSVVISGLGAK